MKEYLLEEGAEEIVNRLNAEMYSTDVVKLAGDLECLIKNYPEDYKKIIKNDPGFIINLRRCMIRDKVAEEVYKYSGKMMV
jgi:hypothetical protein